MSTDGVFIKQKIILPDFSAYYAGFGAAANGHLQFMSTVMPDINGDGKDDIVLFLNEMQASFGVVTTGPTPNREIILTSQSDGTYRDATVQLLGSAASAANGFSLLGYSNETVVADINVDARPDIIIAESREDGRSIVGANKVNAYSISQVQISQSDGTYKTLNIGEAAFCGKGSIQVLDTNSGTEIFLASYHPQSTSKWTFSNSVGAYTQPVFKLNSAGTGFEVVGQVATDAYGAAVLSSSRVVTQVVNFVDGVPAGNAYAVEKIDSTGNVTYGAPLLPFQSATIDNYIAWNGDKIPTNVYKVNGELIGAGLYAVLGSFVASPTSSPVVVTQLEGSVLGSPHSDGCYYQLDGQSYSKINFWNVVGDQLVSSNIKLIGENTRAYTQDFQFIDIDHNGLSDFVVDVRADGKNGGHGIPPDVYLNDGAGDLVHVNQSFIPSSDITANYIGKFADFNGDGNYDLLYTPWYPNVYAGNNTQPEIFYGTSDFESAITQSITITDRHAGSVIRTWAGNDTFYDTNANTTTTINGGLGIDKSVYSGNSSSYAITHNADGTTLVKSASLADTLTSVERLQFSDKKIALDVTSTGNTGKALEFIGAIAYNLVSDKATVGGIQAIFDAGNSMTQICQIAVNCGLTSNLAGSNSNADLAKLVLKNVIGTTPGAADIDALTAYMDGRVANMSQSDFLATIATLAVNDTHINLVGLASTGVEYV